MQRFLFVVLALVALACVWFQWFASAVPPLPVTSGAAAAAALPSPDAAASVPMAATDTRQAAAKSSVSPRLVDERLADPEIRAGLCGFVGRIVATVGEPAVACPVRLYRVGDDLLPNVAQLLASTDVAAPDFVAGDATTGADGRFRIDGVWPGGFYLLHVGSGSAVSTHRLVTRVPSPGETIDLGDIVLPPTGVLSGRVVDENGDPVAGALVRTADVPVEALTLFPFERFDPAGVLIARERGGATVLELPNWVGDALAALPIPSVLTATDGSFRLAGVLPGPNLVAISATEFAVKLQTGVLVRAEQAKELGDIRLTRGEAVTGRVVDAAGKAIPGAEVVAATVSAAALDPGRRLAPTDDEGRFHGAGFGAGKVTVAARRGPGEPWLVAAPQSILGDILLTLGNTFTIEVTVATMDGVLVPDARLGLLCGNAADEPFELAAFGFAPPVDLGPRQREVKPGRWRLENVPNGSYQLLVDAPGHGPQLTAIALHDANLEVAVKLAPSQPFRVLVVGDQDVPIPNADIVAQGEPLSAALRAGRTDAAGRCAIDAFAGDSLRVAASHPRWGTVVGEAKPGVELCLRMARPGALRGVLRDGNKPPPVGRFTIVLNREPDGTALQESTPMLLSPGPDGTFVAAALQPGRYTATAMKALDAIGSPGSLVRLLADIQLADDSPSEPAEIVSGQTAQLLLDVGEQPIEGPTAQFGGSVTINGQMVSGAVVTLAAGERNRIVRTDERGRFDFGIVAAGEVQCAAHAPGSSLLIGQGDALWSSVFTLAPGEQRDVTITLATSSVSGVCVRRDGTPAAGAWILVQGTTKTDTGAEDLFLSAMTDDEGKFRFAHVVAGPWRVTVQHQGDEPGRCERDLDVRAGVEVTDLRLQLERPVTVAGRVELAGSSVSDGNGWIGFYRLPDEGDATGEGTWVTGVTLASDGAFTTEDLGPGRFRALFSVGDGSSYACEPIVVPAEGLSGVVLRRR
jgi:hypothetical protein